MGLLTEIVSPYRIPPFNELARTDGIDLHVGFLAETESRRAWEVPTDEIAFTHEVLTGWAMSETQHGGSLFVNPGVLGWVRNHDLDLLVLGGWHQPTYWAAALWASATGTPIILWSESTRADRGRSSSIKEVVKRWMVSRADAGLVVGRRQEDYLSDLGMERGSIHHMPNAVDNEFFRDGATRARKDRSRVREDLDLEGTTYLYLGRMVDYKGVPDILEAYERLEVDEETSLLLVGSGPRLDAYRTEAKERNLANVTFTGFEPRERLPELYGAADAFVFPTHSDPWGLVLNEAMAAGLPVVASTAAGATDELVLPGENGFTFDPGDVDALANHMQRLHDDPAERKRLAQGASERIREFSPARMAQGMARAARETVDAHDSSTR